jgi:hypothetical protein
MGKWFGDKAKTTNEGKPMTRPTKDMTKTTLTREQMLALFQDDDALRRLLQSTVQEILEGEMDEALGAGKGERNDTRRGYRSGYYGRKLTTRVGTLELRVPQDRGGLFRTEVFVRYQRSEKALLLALAEMYIQGVSRVASHAPPLPQGLFHHRHDRPRPRQEMQRHGDVAPSARQRVGFPAARRVSHLLHTVHHQPVSRGAVHGHAGPCQRRNNAPPLPVEGQGSFGGDGQPVEQGVSRGAASRLKTNGTSPSGGLLQRAQGSLVIAAKT